MSIFMFFSGYTGINCSEKVDVCKGFVCPQNSVCVQSSDLKTATCKCNEGKTFANKICKGIYNLFYNIDQHLSTQW